MTGRTAGTAEPPGVAVVIVSFNTRDDLLRCLASLRGSSVPLEIVVVDNASADGSARAVADAFPEVRLLQNAANEGYARANNRGIRETKAPFVLLLNSDTEVRNGMVEGLLAALAARTDAAIAGPRTIGSDGRIQVSTGPDLTPWNEWRQRRLVLGVKRGAPGAIAEAERIHSTTHEPVWVSGSCLLIRRSALEGVGGLDEEYFLYEEDVDLCVRVRQKGGRVLFVPTVEVVHHLGRSVSRDPDAARLHYHRSHLRYYRKHRGVVHVILIRAYFAALATGVWLSGHAGSPREAAMLLRLALRGH